MKVKCFLWLLFFVSTTKINSQELYKQGSSGNSSDTFSMVDALKTLYLEGNPETITIGMKNLQIYT
tara:strand:+ start:310 stop:507 length:198 start_codon:yes stop_codon:yes gene_type:complete